MASAEVRTGVPPDIFVKKKKTDIFRRFSRKLRIEKALQLDFERVVFKESSKQGASKQKLAIACSSLPSQFKESSKQGASKLIQFKWRKSHIILPNLKKAPNKEHRN